MLIIVQLPSNSLNISIWLALVKVTMAHSSIRYCYHPIGANLDNRVSIRIQVYPSWGSIVHNDPVGLRLASEVTHRFCYIVITESITSKSKHNTEEHSPRICLKQVDFSVHWGITTVSFPPHLSTNLPISAH